MGALDRFRRRLRGARPPAPREAAASAAPATPEEEARLWATLRDDPNDVQSFHALAEIVRHRAEEGHESGDPRKAADDAVWALAEELAHSGRAWYPLIELGRLSVHDDREQALKPVRDRVRPGSHRRGAGHRRARAARGGAAARGARARRRPLAAARARRRGRASARARRRRGRPARRCPAHPRVLASHARRRGAPQASRGAAAASSRRPSGNAPPPARPAAPIPVVDVRERKLFKR